MGKPINIKNDFVKTDEKNGLPYIEIDEIAFFSKGRKAISRKMRPRKFFVEDTMLVDWTVTLEDLKQPDEG